MDTTDSNIHFYQDGVCNHCHEYDLANDIPDYEYANFQRDLEKIRNVKGEFNCLVGVSGGLDSTFLLLHLVKDLKLRPLAVHIDNGWNTGLAARNIVNVLEATNTLLHTEVLYWPEMRRMQEAILKAGVPDLEAPTDLFINFLLRKTAKRFGIKYIISGTNPQTEAIMGSTWSYGQRDPVYLEALYRQSYGNKPRRLPFFSVYRSLLEQIFSRYRIIRPLKYITYSKRMATERVTTECQWIEYPRKHGESFITRFYQDYFLPRRFGADKRRAHYSNLIRNGDMTRSEALTAMQQQLTDPNVLADIEYFSKKMQISEDEFDSYMATARKSHADYRTMKDMLIYKVAREARNMLGAKNIVSRWLLRLISH